MSYYALIVAAGSGDRFRGAYPKQYEPLGGMTVLRRCLEVFLGHETIEKVYVVYDPVHEDLYRDSVKGLEIAAPICGGETRQESCYRGLLGLQALGPPDQVLIHDAARPLVDHATITRICEGLRTYKGVIPGIPVVDTLKKYEAQRAIRTLDRKDVWYAQTPQGFHFETILEGHKHCVGMEATDDARILEEMGVEVMFVEGSMENFKLTTRMDLEHAQRLLETKACDTITFVTGLGFDVHRFGEGRKLVLCGVEVGYEKGLVGHSDADVGLHAVTDGLLGSIGLGDIGDHFPPTDMRWKNVSSRIFLRHALDLVRKAGGEVCHIDITVLCEWPKLSPYKEQMRRTLGELCDLPEGRTSIKATTTEGLGFIGLGEGIAAQAVVTVRIRNKIE